MEHPPSTKHETRSDDDDDDDDDEDNDNDNDVSSEFGDLCDNVLILLEKGHDGYLEYCTREPIFFGTHHGIVSHASAGCPVCTLILKMIPWPTTCHQAPPGPSTSGQNASSGLANPADKSAEYYITASTHSELMRDMISLSFTSNPEDTTNMRRISIHDGEGKYHGQIYYLPAASTSTGAAFLRNKNDLYPSLLASWIASCSHHHHHHHDDVKESATALTANMASSIDIELTFIDVVNLCLVRSSSVARYLSLSYVWGRVSGLQLRSSNRRALEVPHALAQFMSEIPRTVTDAMHLTREMGERFLWVDSLCIEQDNALQKHFNISQMNIVYSQSVATLVVLSGQDASHPIPGVTSHRLRLTEFVDLGGDSSRQLAACLVAEFPGFEDIFKKSKYETRAWTMQERLLSSRCIFLTDRAAYLYCQHGLLTCDSNQCLRRRNRIEGRAGRKISTVINPFRLLDDEQGTNTRRRGASVSSVATIMSIYTALVHQYTARELSYSIDSLNAFSGMLTALHSMSGIEPFCGLLKDMAHYCLFWIPVGDSDAATPVATRVPDFPSWSWAGWTGPKSYFNGPLYLHDFIWKGYNPVGREPSLSLHIPLHKFVGAAEAEQPSPPNVTGDERLCISTRAVESCRFSFVGPQGKGKYGIVQSGASWEPCGFYYQLAVPLSDQRRMAKLHLLEISASACLIDHNWQPRSVPGAHFMNNVDPDPPVSPRCITLIHVLIVEWLGGRVERVGLASIQSEYWTQMEPVTGRYVID